jgi:hypothetical protein
MKPCVAHIKCMISKACCCHVVFTCSYHLSVSDMTAQLCVSAGEVGYLLDGSLPNRTNMAGVITRRAQGFIDCPSIAECMHCVVMCIPAPSATDKTYMTRLQDMVQFSMKKGMVLDC